ncbi:hypothetical protein NDR87_11790 [Nocardia sp. CDC159]|uniref:Ubiquitin-like domain-containing protein n=1 Tax=Nocardia pulmonis TaxID=2951408 RepID=A0A9X2E5R2_9NOCA|nr:MULTISPECIES: ubiquitin-like protein [Nocardia]MCM6774155.1 hypothetical protein [Nocardia pulmonis]MCM6787042.1 hypothetical protein [Nocardia sp. CDC159]
MSVHRTCCLLIAATAWLALSTGPAAAQPSDQPTSPPQTQSQPEPAQQITILTIHLPCDPKTTPASPGVPGTPDLPTSGSGGAPAEREAASHDIESPPPRTRSAAEVSGPPSGPGTPPCRTMVPPACGAESAPTGPESPFGTPKPAPRELPFDNPDCPTPSGDTSRDCKSPSASGGPELTVQVTPDTTVAQVKEKIAAEVGISPHHQRLYRHDIELENDRPLSHYSITERADLDLRLC